MEKYFILSLVNRDWNLSGCSSLIMTSCNTLENNNITNFVR